MAKSGPNPRFILGLKLRRLRTEAGLTLRALARQTGMSISYLSEIEKGLKYPKPERLQGLARALEVSFDDLVSLRVSDELSPVKSALDSPFLQEFPFELFGFDTEDLVRLVITDPARAGALIRAVIEVAQSYDVDMESFLLAALRAYQEMNRNHFEDLEAEAGEFRRRHGWAPGVSVPAAELERVLTDDFGYRVDTDALARDPELSSFRSVYRHGDPPVLYVHGALLPSQRAFVVAREIGHAHLDLEERAVTSSWLRVESFDQVLNNFKASYFSGALLLDADTVVADVKRIFDQKRWQPEALLAAMDRFDATPETYLTRLTQLVPARLGVPQMFFVRMTELADGGVRPTKHLNLSALPIPVGRGLGEHQCRRWPAFRQLAVPGDEQGPMVLAQRSRFLDTELDFLMLSTVRPLLLDPARRSTVTLGLELGQASREAIRFWDDPAIAGPEVNLTCERCPLGESECSDRVAEATALEAGRRIADREQAVARLLERS